MGSRGGSDGVGLDGSLERGRNWEVVAVWRDWMGGASAWEVMQDAALELFVFFFFLEF